MPQEGPRIRQGDRQNVPEGGGSWGRNLSHQPLMESKGFCDYSPERLSKWELRPDIASGLRDNESCEEWETFATGVGGRVKRKHRVSFFFLVFVLGTATAS